MSYGYEYGAVERLIRNYESLLEDIYPQPEDEGHAKWAQEVIDYWMPRIKKKVKWVLDVGCGQAFVQPMFEKYEVHYTGITLGSDVQEAEKLNRNVMAMDFNFLMFRDDSADLIFSRHSLEHSPFPLLTLMEWHRACKKYLILVLPTPEKWGWAGRNHYSVMHKEQVLFLLDRAGFEVIDKDEKEPKEYRFLCEKMK